MDYSLISELETCDGLIRDLQREHQKNREDIPECVGGEILKEYQKASDLAEGKISKVQQELYQLLNDMLS